MSKTTCLLMNPKLHKLQLVHNQYWTNRTKIKKNRFSHYQQSNEISDSELRKTKDLRNVQTIHPIHWLAVTTTVERKI